jgi:hypothetical protein
LTKNSTRVFVNRDCTTPIAGDPNVRIMLFPLLEIPIWKWTPLSGVIGGNMTIGGAPVIGVIVRELDPNMM